MSEREQQTEKRENQIIELVKKNKDLLSISEGVKLEINIKGTSVVGKITVGLRE